MSKIWLTSDTHFGHDRDFIWSPRGFTSATQNDKEIIKRWNSVVSSHDIVYHLGDVMLGDNKSGMSCLRQLNGNIFIIQGNHDTKTRLELYDTLPNVCVLGIATIIKYNGLNFYLSHYPTLTENFGDQDKPLRRCTINLFGHTHQETNFYENNPCMYHVGVDSHNSTPVLLDDIIEEIRKEKNK